MEQTLVILKPSAIERNLIGEVIGRIEKRGLIICGIKMIQPDKSFFPLIVASMVASPVIVMCLKGIDAVKVFREMTGATNGRKAAPGTLRGDLCVSGQMNIVHASDSVENAKIELARFFKPEEIFDYTPAYFNFLYAEDEL